MHSHRASALLFYLTNALLVYKGALSLEAQAEASGSTETNHKRTLGRTANDDEVLRNILPLVTFDCLGKNGYFADKKFDCEVFHYCDPNGSRSTFHCPNNFFFNSELMVCEQMTESKKGLCWKNEDGDHKEKKTVIKNISDAKIKISEATKKKTTEKSSAKSIADVEDLEQVASHVSVSFSKKVNNMDGMMALEDVLSYMNADSNPEHPKTFTSTFLKTSGDREAKALVNTSIINPFKKLKGHASDHDGNPQDVEIQKTSSKRSKEEEDLKTDASEAKLRKRKRGRRGGRTLNSEESWPETNSARHHSHISERSPADDNAEESKNYDGLEDKSSSAENSPSSSGSLRLFDIDSRRNTTDPWRKRRRYYRRRRKNRNQSSSTALYENSPDNTTEGYDQTTSRFLESHRTKGKKSDIGERQRPTSPSNVMKPQISTSIKVSFLKDGHEHTDSNSHHTGVNDSRNFGEISAKTNSEPKVNGGSNHNPWFKSTLTNEDDNGNFRFGERTTTSGIGFAPEPFYGDENGSVAPSHFLDFEDKPDRSFFNQNVKAQPDELATQRPKLRFGNNKKSDSPRRGSIKAADRRPIEEERKDTFWSQESPKESQKKNSDGQFQHSNDKIKRPSPQKTLDPEWSSQWSPIVSEVTTLSPALPLKAAFSDNHEPNIAAVMEEGGIRWKQRETSERKAKPKVPVGSSYKQWKEEPKLPPHEIPKLNTTPSTRVKILEKHPAIPHRNIHRDRKKEWPKQTLAHQHLSKVMNDFLAIPPVNLGLPKPNHVTPPKSLETFVPKYRIPNEDIYVSESIPKETVKNQRPDIFEIVDLISKHSIGKQKETAMPSTDSSDGHRVTIKDALMSAQSLNENKEKVPASDIEIVDLRETLEDLFGPGIEKIFGKDHSKEYEHDSDTPRIIKGSIKKISELSQEEREELKEITEIAKFTSLRLKPLLTSVLRETSKELSSEASKATAERTQLRPTIITAKKVPLRVLYADDDITSKESAPKKVPKRPSAKAVRNRPRAPRFKMMRHTPPAPNAAMPIMVLHPPSLRPPHPPPLYHRYAYPMMPMPYGGIRPMFYHQHYPYIPRRRKRSPQFLKRIGSQRWKYSPFSHGMMSPLASNHGSSFFRRPFILHRFPSPILPSPFRFPYALAGNTGILRSRKPRLRKPVFLTRQPIRNIAQPVRHISQAVRNIAQPVRNIPQQMHNIPQTAHQTVIIEEVPIPIPVQVSHLSPPRVPTLSSVRVPEALRPVRPPHFQDSRGNSVAFTKPAQLHQAPFPFSIGLIESAPKPRPPPGTYSQPVKPNQAVTRPTGGREAKFQLNLPASQNSASPAPPTGINPNSNRNIQNRPLKPKPPVILTQAEFQKRPFSPQFAFPFDTKDLHVQSYPNFSYFHTGPPSSFSDFLSPNKQTKPKNPDNSGGNKETPKSPVDVNARPISSRPVKASDPKYRENRNRLSTPSSVGITSSPAGGLFVVSPPDSSTYSQNSQSAQGDSPPSFSWSDESKDSTENGISNQRPKPSPETSSKERKVRRRRPGGRRRRPRPKAGQGLGNSTLRDNSQSEIKTPANIWKIASPPQQIPPPPSEITTQTLNTNIENDGERSTNKNVPTNIPTTSNPNAPNEKIAFPPAGYYGSEQLSKILETSFSGPIPGINSVASLDYSTEIKLPPLSTTEQPAEESSMFSGEESAFYDELDDGHGRVPFGTRLKNKPRSRFNPRQNTKPPGSSPDMTKVVRNMQSGPPPQNRYRGSSFHEPGSQSSDLRDTVQLPARRKPDRPRYSGPDGRLNKGIRPEVIYYDTREHPDGLFKIETDVHNSKPPSPVLVRTHAGTRDMFHLPNPYSDRDLFGINPPSTPRPVIGSNGFYGPSPLRPPPREKTDFAIPRRPHMDHSPIGSPSLSDIPSRPSGYRPIENQQQQFRVRERKRPTTQPKPKNEIKTSSLSLETTTARTYSFPTQVNHRNKEIKKTPEYPFYPHKQESSVSPKDVVTQRWTIKTTTTTSSPVTVPESSRSENIVTTTPENLETKSPIEKVSGFLPVRGIPKTIHGAKLDLNKINASISTSVSVSSSSSGNHVSSGETSNEGQPKKVFSSKNGGLAVVRKGSRQRKRNRNRPRTTAIPKVESTPSRENGLNDEEKLQIAASIQDIIKATSESERVQETQPPPTSQPTNLTVQSSKVSKKWIIPPPEDISQTKNGTQQQQNAAVS